MPDNALEIWMWTVHGHRGRDPPRPRCKQRYRAFDKTFLRVNHLRQHAISKQLAEQMRERYQSAFFRKIDLLMFSDYQLWLFAAGTCRGDRRGGPEAGHIDDRRQPGIFANGGYFPL